MQVENIKTWQWMLVGLLIGVVFGGMKLWQGPFYDSDQLDSLDQQRFERSLLGGRPQGVRGAGGGGAAANAAPESLFRNLVVHPPLDGERTGSDWVTGKIYRLVMQHENLDDAKSPVGLYGVWSPFKYRAPVPYRATAVEDGNYPSVADYLRKVRALPSAHFEYHSAWWEATNITLAMTAGAGFLLIGVAWPAILGVMQRVGLARKPTIRPKLAAGSASASPAAVVDSAAQDAALAKYNADLEESMPDFGQSAAATSASDSANDTIRKLDGAPEPSVATSSPPAGSGSDYGGEFYPVVRSKHHDTDEH